jgi:hypothetical protein
MTTTPRSPVRRALADATARTTANRRVARQDAANAQVVSRQREALSRRKRVMRSKARMANARLAAAAPGPRPDQGAGYTPQPYKPTSSDVITCPICNLLNGADACFCDQCSAQLEGSPDVVTDGPPAAQAAMLARRRGTRR